MRSIKGEVKDYISREKEEVREIKQQLIKPCFCNLNKKPNVLNALNISVVPFLSRHVTNKLGLFLGFENYKKRLGWSPDYATMFNIKVYQVGASGVLPEKKLMYHFLRFKCPKMASEMLQLRSYWPNPCNLPPR